MAPPYREGQGSGQYRNLGLEVKVIWCYKIIRWCTLVMRARKKCLKLEFANALSENEMENC